MWQEKGKMSGCKQKKEEKMKTMFVPKEHMYETKLN